MRLILILILLANFNCYGQEKLGKADIVELKNYEKEDEYFPHDCTMESDMLDKAIELDKNVNTLTIKNIANDGFTGHSIKFLLNSKLEVKNAEYDQWTDVLDGSTTTYKIDSVKLKLNSDPFKNKKLIGYYTVFMTVSYKPGEILEREDVKDEVYQQEFKGKFNTDCNK